MRFDRKPLPFISSSFIFEEIKFHFRPFRAKLHRKGKDKGGFYHLYNRLGRGERVFDQETEAEEFIARGAELLGVEIDALRSRRQDRRLARARELLMILGVERYRLKLKDLAMELQKSPDGMTKTVARAANRRTEDGEFRVDLNELGRALAGVEG